MRWLVRIAGALLGLVALVFLLQKIAAESGEVVVVKALDAQGAPHETRIWIVDHEGAPWIRTSNQASRWMTRVLASPEVEVTRGGETRSYRAVPVPEAAGVVNGLMAEKYGWADQLIGFLVPRDQSQVVRLDPR